MDEAVGGGGEGETLDLGDGEDSEEMLKCAKIDINEWEADRGYFSLSLLICLLRPFFTSHFSIVSDMSYFPFGIFQKMKW